MTARGPFFAAELLKALQDQWLSVRGVCAAAECSEPAAIYWLTTWEELGVVVSTTGTKGPTGYAPKVYTLARHFGGVKAPAHEPLAAEGSTTC